MFNIYYEASDANILRFYFRRHIIHFDVTRETWSVLSRNQLWEFRDAITSFIGYKTIAWWPITRLRRQNPSPKQSQCTLPHNKLSASRAISSKSRTTLPVFASLSLMFPLRSLCPKRRITWSTLSLTGTDPEQQIPSLGLLCAPSSHMWWKQQSLLLPGRKYRMHHWWPGKMRTTLSDWSPVWKGNHTTVKSCLYF